MQYVIGFDGGGSKTRAILANQQGKILADESAGPSNHQIVGLGEAKKVIHNLYKTLLNKTAINAQDINYIHLGLAGADLPDDFKKLNDMGQQIFGDTPFSIVNDAWIIFRSGLKKGHGIVSIYGTGANVAGVNKNGDRRILRALGYALGGYGGGGDMTLKAFYDAFRSNEKTGPKTRLEKEIPKLLGYKSIEELIPLIYPKNKIFEEAYGKVPPLIFKLANENDAVSISILKEHGKIQGEMIIGILKQLDIKREKCPIVIGGSIYKGSNDTFINTMLETVKVYAPNVYLIRPEVPPVYGALYAAFDTLNLEIPVIISSN